MDQGLLGFATLLIGLTIGRQPVELMAARPVAQVRLQLDRHEVAVLSGAPWRAEIDFGQAPVPRRLEAIGLDAAGVEVARATQWVNLPRPEAELDLLIERDEAGRAVAAKIAWMTARQAAPSSIRAVLDGAALTVKGAERVLLPPSAAGGAHFLRVEAEFPDGKTAAREVAFGGAFAEASSSSLTAIPVEGEAGEAGAPATVTAALVGGEPLRVAAVERGAARVVVVLDRSALEPLRRAARTAADGYPARWAAARTWGELKTSCRWLAEPLRSGDDQVFIVDPRPDEVVHGGVRSWLFTVRSRAVTRVSDLVGVLMRTDLDRFSPSRQALANAVANAGLVAAAGGYRRAVLLILGSVSPDDGDLDVAGARELLRRLDVPLHVWSPVPEVASAGAPEWGAVSAVTSCRLLGRASEALAGSLDRQRIVWVDGLHLPHDVVVFPPQLRRSGG